MPHQQQSFDSGRELGPELAIFWRSRAPVVGVGAVKKVAANVVSSKVEPGIGPVLVIAIVLVLVIGAGLETAETAPPVGLIVGEPPELVAANFYFGAVEKATSTVVSADLQACSLSEPGWSSHYYYRYCYCCSCCSGFPAAVAAAVAVITIVVAAAVAPTGYVGVGLAY